VLESKATILVDPLCFLAVVNLFGSTSETTAGWVALIFVLAALTDWLDGYLARKWVRTSNPVADQGYYDSANTIALENTIFRVNIRVTGINIELLILFDLYASLPVVFLFGSTSETTAG
jgi:hypothetical protein